MSRIEVWLSLVEHYVRDVGAASSNLVTSTIENARSFGRFPVAACFVLSGGSLKFVRHLCAVISKAHEKAGQNITRNRRRRLYFGAVFILCLLVVFPCHKIPQPPGQAGFFIVPTSPRYTLSHNKALDSSAKIDKTSTRNLCYTEISKSVRQEKTKTAFPQALP